MATECTNTYDQTCRGRLTPSYCADCYRDVVEQRDKWREEARGAMKFAKELAEKLSEAERRLEEGTP